MYIALILFNTVTVYLPIPPHQVELVMERVRLRGCGEPEKEEKEERQQLTTAPTDSSSPPASQSALLLH
jgi:hypothetical protein